MDTTPPYSQVMAPILSTDGKLMERRAVGGGGFKQSKFKP